MDRIWIIAIAVILGFALWSERARFNREIKAERDKVETLQKEAKASAEALAVANASKGRVREIVREVQLPPTGVACASDPAVLGARALVERMRNAAGSGDSAPPGGTVAPLPAKGPDG